MKRKMLLLAVFCLSTVPTWAITSGTLVINDVLGAGVDVGTYITECITQMGAIVVTALGGYFAFLLIRRGLRWVRTAI